MSFFDHFCEGILITIVEASSRQDPTKQIEVTVSSCGVGTEDADAVTQQQRDTDAMVRCDGGIHGLLLVHQERFSSRHVSISQAGE